MRHFLLIVVTVLFSLVTHGATITAVQDTWPPFSQKDEQNPGISVEIVIEAFKASGHTVNFKIMPWARALNEVKHGNIDVLVATWLTTERTSFLKYSEPYLENSVKFIKRKGDGFQYNGLDSLSGKMVGIIRNYGYGDEFLNSKNFKKPEANDLVTNAKKLLAKRIDLTLEDEVVAKSTLSGAGMNLTDFAFTDNALSVNPLHITVGLVNPNHMRYIKAFNEGLAEIKENGTFERILVKYGIH